MKKEENGLTNEQAFIKANYGVSIGELAPFLMISVSKCYNAMDLLRKDKSNLEYMDIKDIETFLRKKKLEKIKKI